MFEFHLKGSHVFTGRSILKSLTLPFDGHWRPISNIYVLCEYWKNLQLYWKRLMFCTAINISKSHELSILWCLFVYFIESLAIEILYYNDVTMGAMASQITSITIVYWTVYSGAEQRKHQSSASLAFVRVIHRWPVNSPHKWPVTRKIFPLDDVIRMNTHY